MVYVCVLQIIVLNHFVILIDYLLLNCMQQFPQTFRPEKHTSIHSAVKIQSLYVNGGERVCV